METKHSANTPEENELPNIDNESCITGELETNGDQTLSLSPVSSYNSLSTSSIISQITSQTMQSEKDKRARSKLCTDLRSENKSCFETTRSNSVDAFSTYENESIYNLRNFKRKPVTGVISTIEAMYPMSGASKTDIDKDLKVQFIPGNEVNEDKTAGVKHRNTNLLEEAKSRSQIHRSPVSTTPDIDKDLKVQLAPFESKVNEDKTAGVKHRDTNLLEEADSRSQIHGNPVPTTPDIDKDLKVRLAPFVSKVKEGKTATNTDISQQEEVKFRSQIRRSPESTTTDIYEDLTVQLLPSELNEDKTVGVNNCGINLPEKAKSRLQIRRNPITGEGMETSTDQGNRFLRSGIRIKQPPGCTSSGLF